jgi:uncharacterized protein YkwD
MTANKHLSWIVLVAGLVASAILAAIWWPVSAQNRAESAADYRLFLPYVAGTSCIPGPAIPPDDINRDLAVEARINDIRGEHGLPRLVDSHRVSQAALRHSNDMADNNFFSHTGTDGSRAGIRLEEACYNWQAYGEIIAAGFASPSSVVTAWMKSPGHKSVILDPTFADFGAGYAYNASSRYKHYWTVDFGLLAVDPLIAPGAFQECSYHLRDEAGEMWVSLYTSQPCDLYDAN